MSVIITGDIHAHAYPGPTEADGSNRRLADIIACLDEMRVFAGKNSVSDLIIAGDLFHDRKGVRPEVLHRIAEWLARCHKMDLAVTVLLGNHDLSVGGDGCTSIMALLKAARIVTSAETIEISGTRFGFIPYTDNPALVADSAKAAFKAKATVLVGHVGIGDPKYSACVPTDYEVPGHVKLSDLRPSDFEQVFLGHYHNAQTMGKNVHYVGSPLQLSFKEVGQEKSFVAYTARKPIRRIVNEVSPRYFKKTAAELLANHKDVRDIDYVRAVNATRAEEQQLLDKFGSREEALRIERRVQADVTQRIDLSGNEAENLAAFVKLRRPDLDAAEREALVAQGSRYLQHTTKE